MALTPEKHILTQRIHSNLGGCPNFCADIIATNEECVVIQACIGMNIQEVIATFFCVGFNLRKTIRGKFKVRLIISAADLNTIDNLTCSLSGVIGKTDTINGAIFLDYRFKEIGRNRTLLFRSISAAYSFE